MTEQKLTLASQSLPTPETEFSSIVHTADLLTSPKPVPHRRKRAIALILVLLLLGGCAAGAAAYSIVPGYSSYHFSDAVWLSGRLDVQIPDRLGQSPFYEFLTVHTTDRNTPWYLGSLFSRYKTFSIQYGTKGVKKMFADGESYDLHTILDSICLEFGSTENELWRRIFPLTDDGIWCDGELDPATYVSESYKGSLLQGGTRIRSWGNVNDVIWIDETLNVCFMLGSTDYTTDELLTFAKQIIDLNHPD